jgi:hypothetical protein
MKNIEPLKPIRLTSESVKKLVLQSVQLIKETRNELNLPLFSRIDETGHRLNYGNFRAEKFEPHHLSHYIYAKAYGYFKPPSTIALDKDLPLEGKIFDQPLLATTATYYCAVHEVIHADDYTDNNRILNETLKHIKTKHQNELSDASQMVFRHSKDRAATSKKEIITTWVYQYVDSATHYRTYLVLKHKRFPKIDNIWVSLYNSIFSPRLFTTIENAKGYRYLTNLLSKKIGKICIVEIAKEYEAITHRKVRSYTV